MIFINSKGKLIEKHYMMSKQDYYKLVVAMFPNE